MKTLVIAYFVIFGLPLICAAIGSHFRRRDQRRQQAAQDTQTAQQEATKVADMIARQEAAAKRERQQAERAARQERHDAQRERHDEVLLELARIRRDTVIAKFQAAQAKDAAKPVEEPEPVNLMAAIFRTDDAKTGEAQLERDRAAAEAVRRQHGEISCMLAKKYADNPGAVAGKAFTLTEKLDGVRCIARVNGSDVEFYTRSGNRINGLDEIAAELAAQNVSAMLDGELLIAGRGALPSKEEYKKTCAIVRSDGRKTGLVYHIFDMLPLDVYDRRATSAPYSARRAALERLQTVSAVEIVPVLYSGTDATQIEVQLQAQRAAHHEGVMINVNDAPYAYGRTETLLKYKIMQDVDLKIVAVNPGTGKNADKCGSVTVEYKGGTVRVGTGLTDALRRAIWAAPAAYIGRVITVGFFEETEDAHGKKSLRFPVFKELREPGKTVSYN